MKLIVLHSQRYLSLNHKGQAIQSATPTEWVFILHCGVVSNPLSVYGRIALKSDHSQCLQPSYGDLHDGCEIYLRPIETDNTSQLWRFATPDQQGYYIIENHNKRQESKAKAVIQRSCIDVCEEQLFEGAMLITYHVINSTTATNQRWKIEM